jgi:hypothetical protein
MQRVSPTIFIFFLLFTSKAMAQPQFSGWLASFNTFNLSKRLSAHFDGQLRSADGWDEVQTILLRPGVNVHLGPKWTATGGYAFIVNRRTLGGLSGLLPEHRAWQQVLFTHKASNVTVAHRLRFEERYISKATARAGELTTNGYDNAYRLRYFLRSIIPLVKTTAFNQGFFLALQNEVLINTGDRTAVNGKTFDQNRLYGAFGYRLPAKLDIEAGYMNQYTVTRTSFSNNHIIQIALYKRR